MKSLKLFLIAAIASISLYLVLRTGIVASTNMDGLMGTLERMEEKVEATEFRAEAYAGATDNSTTAQKIDAMIGNTTADDTLSAFRAKRNTK